SWNYTKYSLWGLLHKSWWTGSDTELRNSITETWRSAKECLEAVGPQPKPLETTVCEKVDLLQNYGRAISYDEATDVLGTLKSLLKDARQIRLDEQRLIQQKKKPSGGPVKKPKQKTPSSSPKDEEEEIDEGLLEWAASNSNTVYGHN